MNTEIRMTEQEQHECGKEKLISNLYKKYNVEEIKPNDLMTKIKEMYDRICELENKKYDIEKKIEEKNYALRELKERGRRCLVPRCKCHLRRRYPAKICVCSKYDVQHDRRSFGDRRTIFNKRDASPCFPNIPPPTSALEFKLKNTHISGDESVEEFDD